MDGYTKRWVDMDADELQTWEREVASRLEDAKTEVTTQEQALAAIQTELARRKLEAFWQQNAGLRLAVGDKLLVTDEWLAECARYKNPTLMCNEGDELVITALKIPSVNFVVVERVNSVLGDTWVNFDIARRMRLAYLQAHGEAVE